MRQVKSKSIVSLSSVTITMLFNSNSTTPCDNEHFKSLRRRNIPHNIRWQFKEHFSPFNPGTWWCRLRTLEKYYILFEPEEASLNYLVTDLATSTDFLISNFSCIVFINFCILLYPYLFFWWLMLNHETVL